MLSEPQPTTRAAATATQAAINARGAMGSTGDRNNASGDVSLDPPARRAHRLSPSGWAGAAATTSSAPTGRSCASRSTVPRRSAEHRRQARADEFDVRNTGRLTHNLAIQIPEGPDGKPEEIARTETMQPGERAEAIKVTLLEGEYRLVCTIANHDDLGQFGSLKVRP